MLLLLGVSFSKSKGQNRINKVLGHTLLIDNKIKSKKKGQISNTLNLSRLVEPTKLKSNQFHEDLKKLAACVAS